MIDSNAQWCDELRVQCRSSVAIKPRFPLQATLDMMPASVSMRRMKLLGAQTKMYPL